MKQNKGHNLRSYISVLQQFFFSNEIHVNNRKMGEQTKKPHTNKEKNRRKKHVLVPLRQKKFFFVIYKIPMTKIKQCLLISEN